MLVDEHVDDSCDCTSDFLVEVVSKEKCARSLMIVSLNACRTGDVEKVNGNTCDSTKTIVDVAGKWLSVRGNECEKFLLQRVQIEGVQCDTVLAESAEIHDTCIRPRCVFVASCSIMVARAHTYPAQCNAAAEQQPKGWRIVDPLPCLGGSTHRWVPVDTHSSPVPGRDGCGWPM